MYLGQEKSFLENFMFSLYNIIGKPLSIKIYFEFGKLTFVCLEQTQYKFVNSKKETVSDVGFLNTFFLVVGNVFPPENKRTGFWQHT
jgi:hypothetical protein